MRTSAIALSSLLFLAPPARAQGVDSVAALRDSLRAARATIDSLSPQQQATGDRVERERRRPAIIFQGSISGEAARYGVTGTLHITGPFGISAGFGKTNQGIDESELSVVGEFTAGSFIPFPLWMRFGGRWQKGAFGLNSTTENGSFVDLGTVLLPGPWHMLVAGRKWTDAAQPELLIGAFYRIP